MLRKMTQTVRIIAAGFAVLLAWSSLAVAQSFPRLKPIPPRRGAIASAARPATPSKPSSWTPLTNQPAFLLDGASNPILLTDGTVLVQDAGFQDWWKLTPDATGSYVNGTWSQVASLPPGYSPLYHSSAVLPDGRLIIEGGEYNFLVPAWTNLGAIYDPVADTWTPVSPPPFFGGCCGIAAQTIGDAQSVVLPDGTFMQADCCTDQAALLDPSTLTWTETGTGKFDPNDEEGWTCFPISMC